MSRRELSRPAFIAAWSSAMVASSKGNDGTSWSGAATAPAAPATVPAPASAPAAPAVPDALRKLLRLIRSGMDPS